MILRWVCLLDSVKMFAVLRQSYCIVEFEDGSIARSPSFGPAPFYFYFYFSSETSTILIGGSATLHLSQVQLNLEFAYFQRLCSCFKPSSASSYSRFLSVYICIFVHLFDICFDQPSPTGNSIFITHISTLSIRATYEMRPYENGPMIGDASEPGVVGK